ncbi:cystathionine beta-lyase [Pseudomonas typographi]|uniref:Cystathionine beta-lyase n=1 Tax=Pseudomonas typographi TaxID=2715964 RepID=A0ABR7YX09_9PSED|nr:cystathionine beta-lyase [Pseudomonas typographi]MBD1551247.1 cystathionine beta-lyase [Pseudomonas typographi]MBD1586259.1 cystathionine beta-lyase [Pseudomonas typographi]MBD1597731.1 cystathionine beta-lyase [Pseudomonas typographi]
MSETITSAELEQWLFDGQELALFDVREHGQYGEAHLFFAVHLPYSRLEIDAPRLAPNRHVRVVLYSQGDDGLAPRAAARLRQQGYGNVRVLAGGAEGWKASGRELFAGVHVPSKAFGELIELACHTPHVSATQLAAWQASGQPLAVLDGRPLDEFSKMSIPGAACCPNGELGLRAQAMVPAPSTPIVINCAGRTRSIIGAQTLINLGVPNPVFALENGTQGWFLADLELEHGQHRPYPPAPAEQAAQRQAAERLAQRAGVVSVAAGQVQQWADDPSRSLFLCDVRTPEEFAQGSLPGAQHAPGGQLIQATDLYVGVRRARVVVFDDDGVRAPIVASWLRQLGHEAFVLQGGLHSGLALATVPLPAVNLAPATPAEGSATVFDLRASAAFIKRRAAGSRWSSRSRLATDAEGVQGPLWLLTPEPAVAQLAADELPPAQRAQARWLPTLEGLAVEEGGAPLTEAERIDFLFFVHDRHAGNKAAARQYLAWETGLLGQMTAQERASFHPLAATPAVQTQLVHAGRGAAASGPRGVNAPVARLSTVLFDSVGQMREARARRDQERVLSYGARGNPNAYALEDLVTELEGGYRSKLFATGLAATAQVFLAYLRPGDHVLITDAVYAPVRRLAEQFLAPFGIAYDYYPADGSGVATLLRDNTRMVYAEVPGSSLFELLDLPALAALCKPRGVLLAVDNTWGAGYLYRPLALGADISIMALTKYVAGHSDVMMGSVCTLEAAFAPLSKMTDTFGHTVSPDDAWLVLRGARSLAARLAVQQRQALEVAQWLQAQPSVVRVFHPALPSHPGHALWKRDFNGSNGLLSVEFRPGFAAERFVDALALFGIGASWGGFESLAVMVDVAERQGGYRPAGPVVRLHIGLEATASLLADLAQGLAEAGG